MSICKFCSVCIFEFYLIYSGAFCNIFSRVISLMRDCNISTLTIYLQATLHVISSTSPPIDRGKSLAHQCRMAIKCHHTCADNKEEMSTNSNYGIVTARDHLSPLSNEGPNLLSTVSGCTKLRL